LYTWASFEIARHFHAAGKAIELSDGDDLPAPKPSEVLARRQSARDYSQGRLRCLANPNAAGFLCDPNPEIVCAMSGF
jgi:hypothetical protein